MNKSEIITLLKDYDLKPKKSLGQNFLIDKNILKKIIKASNLEKENTIIEVGPGLGILTKALAKTAKEVIAIEKDAKLTEILKKELSDYKNTKLINKDILKLNIKKILSETKKNINYKVISNLPYYITSPVIRKFLEEETKPKSITLLIQKEVAQRICKAPPDMSLLSTSVQFYGSPKIISYVSKNCFWPKPKVDSAILKIKNIKNPDINEKQFFKIVKAGFSKPRKQLAGNLSKEFKINPENIKNILIEINLKEKTRAEELKVEQWKKLANKLTQLTKLD